MSEALLEFLKQQTTISYNKIGLRLFHLKLDRYLDTLSLENLEKAEVEEKEQDKAQKDQIINAIINYADSNTTLKAFNLLRDIRLLPSVLSGLQYSLCLPQEKWSPENFLIKGSDKEIEDQALRDLEKRNEEETTWLKTKLIPSLHPSSTFLLNKPMVFYEPKRADDYLFNGVKKDNLHEGSVKGVNQGFGRIVNQGFGKNKRFDDKEGEEDEEDEEDICQIRRILIFIVDKMGLHDVESLIRLRMKKNVQVRVCLCTTDSTNSSPVNHEFIEWLSTKLEIPLIKFDLTPFSSLLKLSSDVSDANDANDVNEIRAILIPRIDKRFENEFLWTYGIPEADETLSKLQFMPVEIKIIEKPNKKTEKKIIKLLNGRNIPYLS